MVGTAIGPLVSASLWSVSPRGLLCRQGGRLHKPAPFPRSSRWSWTCHIQGKRIAILEHMLHCCNRFLPGPFYTCQTDDNRHGACTVGSGSSNAPGWPSACLKLTGWASCQSLMLHYIASQQHRCAANFQTQVLEMKSKTAL